MLTNKLLIFSFMIQMILCTDTIVIESTQPHNKNCYTQGLLFLNRTHMFQSCGLYGSSYFHVLQYQAAPFQIRQSFSTAIPWKNGIFLEGAVLFKGFIYILTWKQHKVYKINGTTFELAKQISWNHEGWGLTANDTHMFATDGSDKVYVVNEEFQLLQTRQVKSASGISQNYINELEYVDGFIYANIYLDSKIVKISAKDWKITNEYDGSNLKSSQTGLQMGQVINGIAYDKINSKFIVTGKHWSKFYQVSFVDFQSLLYFASTFLMIFTFISML